MPTTSQNPRVTNDDIQELRPEDMNQASVSNTVDSAFPGQPVENLRDDSIADDVIPDELIEESTGNDTLNEATPPESRDQQSASGTTPDPESDDDVLLMSQQVGLRVDEDEENPQELDIAKQIEEAERAHREN